MFFLGVFSLFPVAATLKVQTICITHMITLKLVCTVHYFNSGQQSNLSSNTLRCHLVETLMSHLKLYHMLSIVSTLISGSCWSEMTAKLMRPQ